MSDVPLILVYRGLLQVVETLVSYWLSGLRIGLYSNPIAPDVNVTISQIQPTTFSGYSGLQSFATWSAPSIDGVRAVTENAANVWTHNGGPVADWVAGYYVVDGAGELVLFAPGANPPALIAGMGQSYQVLPEFSQSNEVPQ